MMSVRDQTLLKYRKTLTKDFLEKQYVFNKKSISQIMRELGIHSQTITYYLRMYKIPIRTPLKQAKLTSKGGKTKYDNLLTKEFLIENYLNKKKGVEILAMENKIDRGTVVRYLKRYRLPIRTTKQQFEISRPPKEFIITRELGSFIDGLLLGDASIPKRKDGTAPRSLTQGCKHREYLEYISKRFLDFGITCSPILSRWLEDERCKNNGYNISFLQTHRYKTFEKFRYRWYLKGKKSMPKNFELTKDILLQCFLSDGNFYREIKLCLDGFDKEDILFLKKLIETTLEIQPRVFKGSSGYELVIKKSDSDKFLKFIGSCPVNCYSYKWKDNESWEAKQRKNLNARLSYRRRKNEN